MTPRLLRTPVNFAPTYFLRILTEAEGTRQALHSCILLKPFYTFYNQRLMFWLLQFHPSCVGIKTPPPFRQTWMVLPWMHKNQICGIRKVQRSEEMIKYHVHRNVTEFLFTEHQWQTLTRIISITRQSSLPCGLTLNHSCSCSMHFHL